MTTAPTTRRAAVALALAFVLPYSLAACATRPRSARGDVSPSSATAAGPRPRRAGDVITAEQIARVGDANGYEALQRLRPELFRGGLPVTPSGANVAAVVLYVDGTRQGSVALLADLRAAVIGEIRYYRPAEALSWFGPGHEGGVVAVRIRK